MSEREVGVLVSPVMRARLDKEMSELLEYWREEATPGNAVPVDFEPSFCERHGTSSVGRATIEYGLRKYSVAPSQIDRKPEYTYVERDMFDVARAFASGKHVVLDVKKVMKPYLPPTPIVDPVVQASSWSEKKLFKHLATNYPGFYVVNPSTGTIWRGRKLGVRVIMLTANEEWKDEVKKTLKECGLPPQLYTLQEAEGAVKYLGSNSPKEWMADSVALVPNPYSDVFSRACDIRDDGSTIVMSYERKKRVVKSVFEKYPERFRYSPQSMMAQWKVSDGFFLESTFPISLMQEDIVSIPHRPLFLSKYPPMCNGLSKDDEFVYDIQSGGTYYSRRFRIEEAAAGLGLKAAPLSSFGTYEVGVYSDVPNKVEGVTQPFPDVLQFDAEEEVEVVRDLPAPNPPAIVIGAVSNPGSMATLLMVEGDPCYVSDMKLPHRPWRQEQGAHVGDVRRYFDDPSCQPVSGFITDDYFVTSHGILPRVPVVSSVQIYYPRHDGRLVLPGMPRGELREESVYRFRGRLFCPIRYDLPLGAMIFGSPEIVARRLPWIITLRDNWHHFVLPVRYGRDREFAGQMARFDSSDRMVTMLQRGVVKAWGDTGMTTIDLMKSDQGLSVTIVRAILSQRADVVRWRISVNPYHEEWVPLSNMMIVLPGVVRPECIDGQKLSDLWMSWRRVRRASFDMYASSVFLHQICSFLVNQRVTVLDVKKIPGGYRVWYSHLW